MNVIVLIVGIAIFVVILFAFIKDEKQRYVLLGGFGIVIVAAFIYTYVLNTSSLELAQLVYSYEQGQVLECNGETVTKQTYNYDYATQSLMGIDEQKGKVFKIKDCTVQ